MFEKSEHIYKVQLQNLCYIYCFISINNHEILISSLYLCLNLMFMVISYKILSGTSKHTIIVLEGGIILLGENVASRETSDSPGKTILSSVSSPIRLPTLHGVRKKENYHNFFLIEHDVRHK